MFIENTEKRETGKYSREFKGELRLIRLDKEKSLTWFEGLDEGVECASLLHALEPFVGKVCHISGVRDGEGDLVLHSISETAQVSKPNTLHILKRTITEEFHYDPEQIRRVFMDDWRRYQIDNSTSGFGANFNEFVIAMFEQHDGSAFGAEYFYGIGNDNVGIELIERAEYE